MEHDTGYRHNPHAPPHLNAQARLQHEKLLKEKADEKVEDQVVEADARDQARR